MQDDDSTTFNVQTTVEKTKRRVVKKKRVDTRADISETYDDELTGAVGN